jgi:hypothetical protein
MGGELHAIFFEVGDEIDFVGCLVTTTTEEEEEEEEALIPRLLRLMLDTASFSSSSFCCWEYPTFKLKTKPKKW